MRRIAIIDHTNHILFVEDINEKILEGQYGGDEYMYIDATYNLKEYSWDWITDVEYIPEFNKDPIEIDFEKKFLKRFLNGMKKTRRLI